ncbi:MAG: TetR/AcrR family transcriptional regulator [Chloroflexota bacterium]
MDARRDEIAEAFKKRFLHFGYKKTSVDDVARDLQISKKTIYAHFNTKEEVWYYVVYQVALQFRNRMQADLASQPGYAAKISALIEQIFAQTRQWLKEGNDAFEFKYKYQIARLAFKDAYAGLVKELIEQGMVAGEFAPAPPDLMLRFIEGVISESMDVVSADPEREVSQNVIEAVLKLLK